MSVLQAIAIVLGIHLFMLALQIVSIKRHASNMTIADSFSALAVVMFVFALILPHSKSSLTSPVQTAWWLFGIGLIDLVIFLSLRFLKSRSTPAK